MMPRVLKTILYVDDEPHIRELVEIALTLTGTLSVETCDSGECALNLLPTLKPDLVLLDAMMPGLDGPGILAAMRSDERFKSVPVIFMTAKAMPSEVSRFIAMGAVGVIPKPFDPMRLEQQVTDLWQQSHAQ